MTYILGPELNVGGGGVAQAHPEPPVRMPMIEFWIICPNSW